MFVKCIYIFFEKKDALSFYFCICLYSSNDSKSNPVVSSHYLDDKITNY